ncbi:MAG: helix-turn-helix domain-containing protein [Bacteroidota bacterium]
MKETVADKIRIERLRLNLSQQNLADELGITVAAYSNLERGVSEISVNRLIIIACILKKSPQWYLEYSNNQEVSDRREVYEPNGGLPLQVFKLIQEMETLKKRVDNLEKRVGGIEE